MSGLAAAGVLVAALWGLPGAPLAQSPLPRPIIVASKPFGESYLLAEMFAQLLEARGFEVDRRLGLGATEIAFEALRTNAIDAYPEYTGTGLLAILGEQPSRDPGEVYRKVAREFRERFGARWLPPLGFQNTYAIAVRQETARRLGLKTLSDLARVSRALSAGLTPDFIGRPDGLPGLEKAYGVRFRAVRALLPAVKYQALAAGEVDVIDGYSTDGFIARYDLVVLEDDRAFFPPYEAAALTGASLQRDMPAAVAALTELSGLLTEADMRRLNRRHEVDGVPAARIAAAELQGLGLTGMKPRERESGGRGSAAGVLPYLWEQRATILSLMRRHLLLVIVSLTVALAVALPLGLALERSRGVAEAVIRSVGLLQTLPSIALLAFMIPLLGIGVIPALVALFLYSLYPILRNTYTGVRDAAPEAVGAAWALGMTPAQVLRHVRLPLAAPVIMAGVRTAAVINVGTATLAAFIGAGGLGDPIAAGLALSDTRMILSGALPAALLALLVDGVLGLCERFVTPGG
jgi:osmoprotectant transport system permease protein